MSSEVSAHLKALLYWLLSPEVLSQIGVYIGVGASIVGFGAKVFTRLWNKLEKKQNEEIDGIKNAISALTLSFQEMQQTQERDFLRLQSLLVYNRRDCLLLKFWLYTILIPKRVVIRISQE